MSRGEDPSTSAHGARALRADALADGEGRIVEVGGTWLAIFRVGGAYYALDNACPHMAGPLGAGRLDGFVVTCPIHYWSFDVRTGCSTTNPSQYVSRFDVYVEDGWVSVRLLR
jgi:nitrite reductase/ring-hydroxylating ferredoxin subunit